MASGPLTLRALVWRPSGSGPFPAILFNHGSYTKQDSLLMNEAVILGPVFAQHGYLFLLLFRRGVGLSAAQGTAGGELMQQGLAAKGQSERNRVQLQLLEGEELDEARAAMALLRTYPMVDRTRLAVVGHSFGGALSLLQAARDTTIRALVVFGAAAASWCQSSGLRARLRRAVRTIAAPILFVHAANDYSTASGEALAAKRQKLDKPYALKIYPPFGPTARDGHNLIFRRPSTWEADVFGFLEKNLRP